MNTRGFYREAAVGGASPLGLVTRLYEQAIEDLRQALQAMERNDIPLRGQRINHAVLVIGHLQSQLDFERGGKVARNLEQFYNGLRENLIQVQLLQSKPLLAQQIIDLLEVRDAWQEAERIESLGGTTTHEATAADALPPERSAKGWEA